MVVFLYTLFPETWCAYLLRVSVVRVVLSSDQIAFAAPRWSMSTVMKSSRSRSPEQARPAVQIWPMWFGWSVICTFLKFEPVLSAFCDCPKYVFQTDGFGLPVPLQSASVLLMSQALPLLSTKATFEFRPVVDW